MMEQPNQWLTQTEQEELAYMYQEEGGPVPVPGRGQQFAEPPLPGREAQCYTPPMAIPTFNPSRSSNFPSFGGSSSLPSLPFGSAMVKNELGQPSPPPSSNFLSVGAGQASTLSFSGWQSNGVQGMMQQLQAPERLGRAPQEHVIAERKRREKLQQQFVSLATIVPGLKKTDKLSLLGSTIDYVKQLEEKVQALEQGSRRSSESMVFDSKCNISLPTTMQQAPAGAAPGPGTRAQTLRPASEGTRHY
ncbi:hypothetical protein CFC21_059295 [Triticum aestivum]|uniref:BHLH domain-containing protein n=2 Tax=Triticum aestivum TaxID=4565 RepID=A0A9R1KED4_WHEAT|nr:hypothetical protein CFC21_059295 [Triticum aestivum]